MSNVNSSAGVNLNMEIIKTLPQETNQETEEVSIFDTEPVASSENRDFSVNFEETLEGDYDDNTTGLLGFDWFWSTRKALESEGIDMDGYEKSSNGDNHFFVKTDNGVTEYLRTVTDEDGNRYVIHSVDDTNTGEKTTNMYKMKQ